MSGRGWRDLIVGDRMLVDEQFAGTIRESGFAPNEWGMIMTAVEFEIEGEGDAAKLVADTSKIDVILPELEGLNQGMGGAPGGPSEDRSSGGGGGGILGALRSWLGGGGDGVDPQRRREAVDLAERYATQLQQHLEERGRWERIRRLAAEESDAEETEE